MHGFCCSQINPNNNQLSHLYGHVWRGKSDFHFFLDVKPLDTGWLLCEALIVCTL